MKLVQDEFIRGGFMHKLVKRTGVVAVYERKPIAYDFPQHYEVVKISSHNGYKMGNQYIEAAETYPGASLWGLQGWTYMSIERAQKRFARACRRFNKKLNYA